MPNSLPIVRAVTTSSMAPRSNKHIAAATTTRSSSVFPAVRGLFRHQNNHGTSSSLLQQMTMPIKQACPRTIVTAFQEPPLDATERPVLVALIQDAPLYGSARNADASVWEQAALEILPAQFGMPCATLDILSSIVPDPKNINDNHKMDTDDNMDWMARGLDSLKTNLMEGSSELALHPHIVLVARGPLVSWLAQLHLESHFLAGLILVDPILPSWHHTTPSTENDTEEIVRQLPTKQEERGVAAELARSFGASNDASKDDDYFRILLQDFVTSSPVFSQRRRPLLLEPGAVPMMVLSTTSLPASLSNVFHQGSYQTVNRHRSILFPNMESLDEQQTQQQQLLQPQSYHPQQDRLDLTGEVPWISIETTENDNVFQDIVGPWIEQQVL